MTPACNLCDDGLILRGNTAVFCDCAEGQRRKRLWHEAGERVKAEAEKDRRRRQRMLQIHDYKAEAAGERQPGEDDESPF